MFMQNFIKLNAEHDKTILTEKNIRSKKLFKLPIVITHNASTLEMDGQTDRQTLHGKISSVQRKELSNDAVNNTAISSASDNNTGRSVNQY